MTDHETMVNIGDGVELWLGCLGQGSPAIILDAPGPHCDSGPWMEIQPRLAQWTRACRYDRAGTGKSTGMELDNWTIPPRVRDLEKLLEAAPIEPPYIMAGYSFGGAIVLRYALEHLDRMAGLILVDAATEALLARMTHEAVPVLPDTGRTPLLGNLPLAVISIDTQEYVLPPLPDVPPEEASKIWLAAQAELSRLSRRGRQIFVRNANHYSILDSHTEDIIKAITMVLDEASKSHPIN